MSVAAEKLEFHPATPERWADMEKLFGPRGACAGCWCMWWRVPGRQFGEQQGEGNKAAMRELVEEGAVPGILAYAGTEPVGWCAVAPREDYARLNGERLRTLKKVDDQPVWSVPCFFVAKAYRHKRLTVALLRAAIDFVKERGGTIVEGYPVDPKEGTTADAFAYTGFVSSFRNAGFVEVLRRSETRPIMRYSIEEGQAG